MLRNSAFPAGSWVGPRGGVRGATTDWERSESQDLLFARAGTNYAGSSRVDPSARYWRASVLRCPSAGWAAALQRAASRGPPRCRSHARVASRRWGRVDPTRIVTGEGGAGAARPDVPYDRGGRRGRARAGRPSTPGASCSPGLASFFVAARTGLCAVYAAVAEPYPAASAAAARCGDPGWKPPLGEHDRPPGARRRAPTGCGQAR